MTQTKALQVIRAAKGRVETVRNLLRALGDKDERKALSARVRRLSRRFDRFKPDRQTAEIYGQLTMAAHELNLTLSKEFYPRPFEE